jgi:hypothetical protein
MRYFLSAIAIIALTTLAQAQAPQQPPLANLPATTVQLPTFSVFNVTTTVSVPDRGSISLGGVDRGVDATVSRGPIRNRGIGSSRTASGMSVHATIIDHSELDRAVLAAAAAKRGESPDSAFAKADVLSRSVARASDSPLPDSVAAIRARTASAADLESTELAGYLAKGRQAEAENKPTVAKVFYQMVARRDHGQLGQQALSRLSALSAPASPTAKR